MKEAKDVNVKDISSLIVQLASPEQIKEWSYGEVKKPETINYRTLRPEKDGLFCEKIFGTTKEWECFCGKYKTIRYKGTICERCGVEVTDTKVRRERMGHITLATPVAHVWYYRARPFNVICTLLDIKFAPLQSVIFYEKYIVIDSGDTDLREGQVLSEEEFYEAREKYGESFSAMMGPEAIQVLLRNLDLEALSNELRAKIQAEVDKGKRFDDEKSSNTDLKRYSKRLEVVENFIESGRNKPEWMILTVIPVIPPDLRPMVQLDGGRFATSDLNELYRRVINRNNRLKRLMLLHAPEIIVRNEKRLLQKAVDALFDNSRTATNPPVMGANNRALRSLAQMFLHKDGRFRQNLLGKRVDYSGRSVIVVGPELELHQCGVPAKMALELFKPFIMRKLIQNGTVSNVKKAKILVEEEAPEVWTILDDVVKEHPVLLNRAPSLHKFSIQSFEPVLVDGKAIKLHPLVCKGFNADFDGDQMAIHVPLTEAAQMECWTLMLSATNFGYMRNWDESTFVFSQDMVLGLNYLTRVKEGDKGEGKYFESLDELEMAIEAGSLSYNAKIGFKFNDGLKFSYPKNADDYTTPGRVILYNEMCEQLHISYSGKNFLPPILFKSFKKRFPEGKLEELLEKFGDQELRDCIDNGIFEGFLNPEELSMIREYFCHPEHHMKFSVYVDDFGKTEINECLGNKELTPLVERTRMFCQPSVLVRLLTVLYRTGFKYATIFGATISFSDMIIADDGKPEHDIVEQAKREIISDAEKQQEEVEKQVKHGYITKDERFNRIVNIWTKANVDLTDRLMKELRISQKGFNPLFLMADSGARGSKNQIRQLCGMRGLMSRGQGEIIEFPIKSNFKEGLSIFDFFISTHGTRKSLSYTAQSTPNTGYVTRKLFDTAHSSIVTEDDCGAVNGIYISAEMNGDEIVTPLSEKILGYFTLEDVVNPVTGNVIIASDNQITHAIAKEIEEAGVQKVLVRSVLKCEAKHGVCRKCYGRNFATNKTVDIGEAVGALAAETIGEPGTQLNLRTFHEGGTAATSVVGNKLEFDFPIYVVGTTGKLVTRSADGVRVFTTNGALQYCKVRDFVELSDGTMARVLEDGKKIMGGTVFAEKDGAEIKCSKMGGTVKFLGDKLLVLSPEYSERLKVGSELEQSVVCGAFIGRGETVVTFDPLFDPIISEFEGTLEWKGLTLGVTYIDEVNQETGKAIHKTVVPRSGTANTTFEITDAEGQVHSYQIPTGAYLQVENGSFVEKGQELARLPEVGAKSNDMAGGILKVRSILDINHSHNPAVLASVDGTIKYGNISKGKRPIIIVDDFGHEHKHFVRIEKDILVHDGDSVKAGDPLCDGEPYLKDIYKYCGIDAAQACLIDQVLSFFLDQGVNIHPKHLQIILREMFRYVKVLDIGDTAFTPGQEVPKYLFLEKNREAVANGGKAAIGKLLMQGLQDTASKAADSFISRISFERLKDSMIKAAIKGEHDQLRGLKENVIVGKLIPAGTGSKEYRNIRIADADIDAIMAAWNAGSGLDENAGFEDDTNSVLPEGGYGVSE